MSRKRDIDLCEDSKIQDNINVGALDRMLELVEHFHNGYKKGNYYTSSFGATKVLMESCFALEERVPSAVIEIMKKWKDPFQHGMNIVCHVLKLLEVERGKVVFLRDNPSKASRCLVSTMRRLYGNSWKMI